MSVGFWEILALLLLVGTGLAVVRLQNAVHAALALIANFLVVAGVYVALEARFVAMIQIIVYAGAIVVLFLFVIMLLSAASANVGQDLLPRLPWVAGLGAAGLAAVLVYALTRFQPPANAPALGGGLPQALGPLLYDPEKWLYALLVVGFLLLVATVAAVVLIEPERIISATSHPAHPRQDQKPTPPMTEQKDGKAVVKR
ncbi:MULTISPECIES: NADH-quinone oxidoreductase subunit J [Meiothermus]|uniref:NADH-quinone oxidoreductase subunit J n=2 Tax=Meiothermus hypogaeus TaxID=884155 RepID=A0A511QZK1_9DEIN|nr:MULTISPECIES: NADH-quinone oxidoreductase subunit J [Meiothermus]RIH80739.1 NADH-quinone oxidoreductase subunit 10 [Meiothermus hypogaeus]GEM82805.1 NADH-quinone oxidoreductase subunit 10 [Meiothermus hypogaeus NBRC 106114]GIW35680.1 MAG: NADH-quinone oxidoreductase subunit 10 [Meiothermus sp.]GIW37774.1 MAG: NADH-quinone oxidoreductase subunit 10 [Meiothermus sp.]